MLHIPEMLFPVEGAAPITTSAGVTCDNISLKDANMVYVVAHLKQAVGNATALTPLKGTAVASCVTALGYSCPIWYGVVTTSSNALTRQTDAASYTMGGAVTGDVIVVFQIDPRELGEYDCLGFTVGASGEATDIVEVMYWIEPKYAQRAANNINYLTD